MNTKSDTDDTESEDLSAHGGRRAGGRVDCEGAMHRPDETTTAIARPRLPGRAVAAVAMVASLLTALVGTGPAAPAPALGDTLTRVVVEARADLGAVSHAVAEQGGRVLEVLTPFPLVVAEVPADEVDDLEADAATGTVTPDMPMRVQSAQGMAAATDRRRARRRAHDDVGRRRGRGRRGRRHRHRPAPGPRRPRGRPVRLRLAAGARG